MHLILFSYLTRNFLKAIGLVAVVIAFTFFVADFLELIRATTNKEAKFLTLLNITTFKIPFILQETYPFIMFFAAIYSFFHLSKKNEYTIMKSSGISVWQFLLPYLMTALIIGIFTITVLNPLSASMLSHSKKLKYRVFSNSKGNAAALIENSGFWFIDRTDNENLNIIIHADKLVISKDSTMLVSPLFTYTNAKYKFIKALKADKAYLAEKHWVLYNSYEYAPSKRPIKHVNYAINTAIGIEDLKNSFVMPKYMSIWDMPYFIATLQASGHSAKQYVTFFYKTVTKPFIATAILFMAAIFALKPIRIFKGTTIIVYSLMTVFIAYFLTEIIFTATMNSSVPQMFVAFILALSANITGIIMLKYSEKY